MISKIFELIGQAVRFLMHCIIMLLKTIGRVLLRVGKRGGKWAATEMSKPDTWARLIVLKQREGTYRRAGYSRNGAKVLAYLDGVADRQNEAAFEKAIREQAADQQASKEEGTG